MKILIFVLVLLFASFQSNSAIQQDTLFSQQSPPADERIESLNAYWAALAKTAAAGDFEGMKSLYHADAVLVKPDTTIAISDAFQFRFSKRIGNDVTAFEKGIYYYTSKETATGKMLGDSYVHFETLLVKENGKWVALMEHQKMEATEEEWELLREL